MNGEYLYTFKNLLSALPQQREFTPGHQEMKMEITTEALLEEYELSNLAFVIVKALSYPEDKYTKPRIVGQNQYCRILRIARSKKYSVGILSDEFLRLLKEKKLDNIPFLSFTSAKLIKLPDELWRLTNLTSLLLSNNELTSLPTKIGQMTKLTSLQLSGNKLGNLPAEIGELTNLVSLNLHSNQLGSLPAEIGKLVKLTSLDLSENQLTSLPVEIENLKFLETLDLNGNPLDFPPEISKNK